MFTGIVEELGALRHLRRDGDSGSLSVGCAAVLDGTKIGDSISVNGCCLTVTELDDAGFSSDVMGETLARTGLGDLAPGAAVNLERALQVNGRLGGHLVQGHVDAVADVLAVDTQPQWTTMRLRLPPALAPYLVEKGSITVDGVSLTVTEVAADSFAVGLIPHTLAVTVLGARAPGDRVNLEADVIAKYVERMLRGRVATPYTTGT